MIKLAGWKAKFLSFAGRAVLVKSVMSAVPNYIMQGVALLVHLCKKLGKISRDFLWGSSSEKRKLHLVGWSKVIKPKEEGGLGIQATRAKNIALLSKLNWRMYQEKNTSWAKVMINKYCLSLRRRARDLDKLPSSLTWIAIKLGFPTFSRGICWGVGNGLRINVWSDSWIKGCSLRELIAGPLKPEENNFVVSNLHQNHEWKWEKL